MKLYTYLLTCDDGFAPNPFYGYCTLACCKSGIRRVATEGDWIIGIRGKGLYERTHGKLKSTNKSEVFRIIYSMRINEVLPFKKYFKDKRFKSKIPDISAKNEKKRAGDNIYKPIGTTGKFKQLQNLNNHGGNDKDHDLSGENVLISSKNDFYYFGKEALPIPEHLRKRIVKCYNTWGKGGQGHLCYFEKIIKDEIINHIKKNRPGIHAEPSEWENIGMKKLASCNPKSSKTKKNC